MIESDPLPPAFFVVAVLTFFAKLAAVRIVLLVTGYARHRQLIAIEIALMAGVAFGRGVFAVQREFRLPVVIETDLVPFNRLMAVVAFRAMPPAMDILQLMACGADGADAFVTLSCVASVASHFGMCAS